MSVTEQRGLCECGCGEAAKGRFLRGHNRRLTLTEPLSA